MILAYSWIGFKNDFFLVWVSEAKHIFIFTLDFEAIGFNVWAI